MLLPCIIQKLNLIKVSYFFKDHLSHIVSGLYVVALVLLPPQKFVFLAYCYYQLWKIKNHEVWVASGGIMFMSSL